MKTFFPGVVTQKNTKLLLCVFLWIQKSGIKIKGVKGDGVFANYFYLLTVNTLDKLKPNLTSALPQLLVVLVMKAFSFIPVALEKCN
jgi:hypothetical protein